MAFLSRSSGERLTVSIDDEQLHKKIISGNRKISFFIICKFSEKFSNKINQKKKVFKGKFNYLLRTEKNKIIAAAATPIAITGSQILEKNGSAGIFAVVNGKESLS